MAALPRRAGFESRLYYTKGHHSPPVNVQLIPPLAGLRFLDRPDAC